MKTKIVIIIVLVFVLTVTGIRQAIAVGPDLTDVIEKAINEKIKYPEFAIEKKINGVVVVEFKINQKGNLIVTRMNSVQPELEEYVRKQLETISFNPFTVDTSQLYYYKFNFDLI